MVTFDVQPVLSGQVIAREFFMEQQIIGFDQDELGDWRAILACGHRQHVRHNPPLVNRPWVLTKAGRDQFLGALLNCVWCDDAEPGDAEDPTGSRSRS